ncbi:hypothetical protein HDF16_003058 [Granulicella aggregans]|uniref:Uncharacterized protein n=1 Tax=Granulicella aggregans TaxID=474949 RepID=A0A7W7ZEB0_9BACT|nr:hypothetical protein [Granulicella aggregans]MBB5058344.1 hypothetical protein [Granulicella aggregans]
MTLAHAVKLLGYCDPLLCLIAVAALLRAKAVKSYGYLATLLLARVAFFTAEWTIDSLGGSVISTKTAYVYYFYTYWTAFAVESVFMLIVICSMYRLAMAPLKGLHTLGMLVFKWVAGISVLVALGSAFAPHITKVNYLIGFVSQMQRTQSILILCLLLFVCFAIRPMGLSYRSRIFGVSLGLGVMATTDMVQSAWINNVNSSMYGAFSLISGGAICLTLLTWTIYFAMPEPKRRLITLPTTSPFLRWNQISEVLGDSPGHVAIAGLPPDMLAPAEIEIMRRASAKMNTTTAWPGVLPSRSTDAA